MKDPFTVVTSDSEEAREYLTDDTAFEIQSELFDISLPDYKNHPTGLNIVNILCQFQDDSEVAMEQVQLAIQRTRRSTAGAELTAEQNAAGTTLPDNFFSRDADALQCHGGSLEGLIRERQSIRSTNRYNIDRFNSLYKDDPEENILRTLATTGARIDTAPDFVPISEPSPMRSLQRRVPLTFRKHILKLWLSENILVLPLADIVSEQPHTSDLHCVFQDPVQKPGGRLLGDLTNRTTGNALNHIDAKPAIVKRFGKLTLPTIEDIIQDILWVASKVGGLHNVRIFKEDEVGAFGQFNYDARDCRYVTFPFAPGYVLVYMTGMFGWSGSPFVFGVLTRAILRQIRRHIHAHSKARMYCDDVMVFAGVTVADADQIHSVNVMEGTFGPNTTCPKKKCPPKSKGELIGWYLDLDRATLRPNDKGIDNLTRAFMSLSERQVLKRREYQVLASLACRYSRGLRGMRPFVRAFFNMVRACRHKARYPSAEAWTSILMWQAVTIYLIVSPSQLAVPLYSFDKSDANTVHLISDAGPIALGLAIYVNNECLGYVSYVLPFDSRDPCYQNCREFMGHLLGKILLLKLKKQHSCITHVTTLKWTGDNISALSWAAKQSCSSTNTQLAFLADCWLSTMHDITTTHVEHRAGVDMDDHDGLSRLKAHSFDPSLNLEALICSDTKALFKLCDPTITNEKSFSLATFAQLLAILVDIDQ